MAWKGVSMERCVYCGAIIEHDDDVHFTCLGEPICPNCALGVKVGLSDDLLGEYMEFIEEV